MVIMTVPIFGASLIEAVSWQMAVGQRTLWMITVSTGTWTNTRQRGITDHKVDERARPTLRCSRKGYFSEWEAPLDPIRPYHSNHGLTEASLLVSEYTN